MVKFALKMAIKKISILLVNFRIGRFLYQELLESGMDMKISVRHDLVNMAFHSPNLLTRYRSESFSIKEPETLSWLEGISKNDVLWDIGANVGLYSIYAAKRNDARVFAFEPSVFNIELLARNIFLNDLQDRVTIAPFALSDAIGSNLFKMSSTTWGGALSTFGQDFDQHGKKLNSVFEYQTIGITMDKAVRLLGIPPPRFIKIDVDGIEHLILRGGLETLKNVESVMIEIDDEFVDQCEETTRHLSNSGLYLLKKCGLNSGKQFNQWWVRTKK